jgi:pyrroline-5-carboxylate reductase
MRGLPESLLLVGAGKMGGALLQGWLNLGLSGEGITVLDPLPATDLAALCASHGVLLNPADPLLSPQVLVLAVKPQMLDAAIPQLAKLALSDTLLISIVAGKTAANLGSRLPQARAIVRAMPNTPAAIGRGITGAWANDGVSPVQRGSADALLKAVGQVEWVSEEALIDAITAVSGSGPAYVFYFTECLAKAAEQAGLPPQLAARLARATVAGAGELMYRSSTTSPSTLRENVTSPAGTTAAALAILMEQEALHGLVVRAVAAAKRRAAELSG